MGSAREAVYCRLSALPRENLCINQGSIAAEPTSRPDCSRIWLQLVAVGYVYRVLGVATKSGFVAGEINLHVPIIPLASGILNRAPAATTGNTETRVARFSVERQKKLDDLGCF